MPRSLLTAEQVAELLGVKPQTVRDAAWRGAIPCVRVWQGRRRSLLRFHPDDIDQLIEDGRETVVPARLRSQHTSVPVSQRKHASQSPKGDS